MEETSGQNLEWFFDQWVYKAGSPRLDVRSAYSIRTKMVTLTVTQTQGLDALTPTAFRLPMEVVIKSGGGESRHPLEITKRVQSFTFKSPVRPSEIILDDQEKVPLKQVKIRPTVMVR